MLVAIPYVKLNGKKIRWIKMNKSKKVSKRNNFRTKHNELIAIIIIK